MRFDFATILVLLVVISGGIWAFDAIFLAPRRKQAMTGAGRPEKDRAEARGVPDSRAVHPPKLVEYARSFFPVFLAVLVLRSFLVEPFRIPSGSMIPTLLVGDFILVNKFIYGIRLPVADDKIIEVDRPKRGDVIVFRYPKDPSTPYIKRVVGLPGDRIAYYDKVLYINGKPAFQEDAGIYTSKGMAVAQERLEHLESVKHPILIDPDSPSVEGEIIVPDDNYFVLGDNRDNSRDSRYWGTVPDDNLIGKAFMIWMNWDWAHGIDWKRIGASIQ